MRHFTCGGGGGADLSVGYFWLGTDVGAPTDPDVTANFSWADGGFPASSPPDTNDTVTFTGNGNNACTFATSQAFGTVTVEAGYMATLGLNDKNLVLDNGSDATFAGGGVVDMGSGTLSLTNGDFDNSGQTTWTRGTSTLSMAGTGNFISSVTNITYNMTVLVGAVITNTNSSSRRLRSIISAL